MSVKYVQVYMRDGSKLINFFVSLILQWTLSSWNQDSSDQTCCWRLSAYVSCCAEIACVVVYYTYIVICHFVDWGLLIPWANHVLYFSLPPTKSSNCCGLTDPQTNTSQNKFLKSFDNDLIHSLLQCRFCCIKHRNRNIHISARTWFLSTFLNN